MNTRIRSSNAKIEKIFKFTKKYILKGRMPKIEKAKSETQKMKTVNA